MCLKVIKNYNQFGKNFTKITKIVIVGSMNK